MRVCVCVRLIKLWLALKREITAVTEQCSCSREFTRKKESPFSHSFVERVTQGEAHNSGVFGTKREFLYISNGFKLCFLSKYSQAPGLVHITNLLMRMHFHQCLKMFPKVRRHKEHLKG